MKKFYSLVLAAALMLLGTQAKAQFHVGFGYLNSTEITRFQDATLNNGKPFAENMSGFYLGATFNIKVAGDFGIAPGFYLDMLFQSERYTELPAYYQKRFAGFEFANGFYRELALNVPINLTYDFEINDNVRIFVYGGVVAQFTPLARTTYRVGTNIPVGQIIGPGGSSRVFYVTNGNTYKYDHLWGDEPDMRPFNLYAGGGVGVRLGDIRIMLGYDHSLLNVSRIEGEKTGRSQIKIGLNFVVGDD